MRIAVCDDEKEIRDIIAKKIKSFCPEAELALYKTGEEVIGAKQQPDILFLDIQMPGRNGMEIAGELRKKSRKMILIFITAMEEYVFQAFDVGAFHYLVKPIADEKLKAVVEGAVRQLREGSGSVSTDEEKYIMIKSGGTHTKILLKDIVYAEVFNRKITIHKMDEDIEYYGRMSELEKKAGEDFFRPHRAYLIHFKYVVKYDASMIWLEKGTALLAKLKFSEFVKSYLRYNRRQGGGNLT